MVAAMPYHYRCEAATLEGFIQQLAIAYVARGYHYYVSGVVPRRLTRQEHDKRMLVKFDVAHSKHARYRRRRRRTDDGRRLASVQYLRHGSFWVLLATPGSHRFFEEHQRWDCVAAMMTRRYRDVRRVPIVYGGYSVSFRNGRTSVRMSRKAYRELKAFYLSLAISSSCGQLSERFQRSPFESYGGVNRQLHAILRAVNGHRKTAGLKLVPRDSICVKRKQLSPFASRAVETVSNGQEIEHVETATTERAA